MTLTKQIEYANNIFVSPYLCKKLIEKKIIYDDFFRWESFQGELAIISKSFLDLESKGITAISGQQILEMLPCVIRIKPNRCADEICYVFTIIKSLDNKYVFKYSYFPCHQKEEKFLFGIIFDEKFADAAAKTLLYLIENDLVRDEWKKQWIKGEENE